MCTFFLLLLLLLFQSSSSLILNPQLYLNRKETNLAQITISSHEDASAAARIAWNVVVREEEKDPQKETKEGEGEREEAFTRGGTERGEGGIERK